MPKEEPRAEPRGETLPHPPVPARRTPPSVCVLPRTVAPGRENRIGLEGQRLGRRSFPRLVPKASRR